MTRGPFLRPTWRALALGAAAAGLGAAGAMTGVEILVWFGLTLACLVTIVAVGVGMQILTDSRRRVERTISPAQLQVATDTRTSVAFTEDFSDPFTWALTDTLPADVNVAGEGPAHQLRPRRRGPLTLGPVLLHRRDPFALFYWRIRVRHAEEHVVWPRTDAVDPELFQRLRTLSVGGAGAPTPEIDDLSLREYRHGDPLSRIYWKRRAAHGNLLVRHDEPGRTAHIDLVLIPGSPARTDAAVEILAAAANELAAPELTLRLLTPHGETSGHIGAVLTGLALAPSGEPAPPQTDPRGVVLIAMADPSLALAQDLLSWIATSPVEPEAVFVFPVVALEARVHELFRSFTVVWS